MDLQKWGNTKKKRKARNMEVTKKIKVRYKNKKGKVKEKVINDNKIHEVHKLNHRHIPIVQKILT